MTLAQTATRIYVDRSRSETYQRCKRLRWLEYHSGSAHRGLSPIRKSIHLVLGGAVHAGLEVLLRESQQWLRQFRLDHDTQADEAAIIEALFLGMCQLETAVVLNIRVIEDAAVLAALDDLRAAMTHGVELDDQEKLAVQQPQQSIATYSSTTSGTFQGKPNAEAAIEITFDGWDIGAGKAVPPANLQDARSMTIVSTMPTEEAGFFAKEFDKTVVGGGTLDQQLKASLGQDWANVQEPKPKMAHISEVADWPEGDLAGAALMASTIDTSGATAKAMTDQALGVDGYLREELAAQVEAMIRAYARRRLRPLLEQFEVLEVEREGEWKLGEALLPREHNFSAHIVNGPNFCTNCGAFSNEQNAGLPCTPAHADLIFMSRLDALLLERQTGYLYLQSYKTTGAWDRRREADAQVDMQGLSEAVDVEKRLGEAWQFLNDIREMKETLALSTAQNEKFTWERITKSENLVMGLVNSQTMGWLRHVPEPPRVLGVRYEYLLKGPRRQDKKDLTSAGFPRYVADTPLIRAYKQDGITADDRRWATSYDWYELTGKSRRLDYRSWQKAPVWKYMPIAAWIDLLDKGEVQPDCYDEQGNAIDILAEQFVPPIHVYRNERDMEDWREQLEAQEIQIAMDVTAVQAVEHDPVLLRSELNKRFPQTRKASSYPGKCPFYDACYGPPNIRENLEETGLFQIRVANHPQENQTGEAPMP